MTINDKPLFKPDADCIIIGGGPAGLTAAIYLGRFLRQCIVIDAGAGRAHAIPRSHNLPGFPDGVGGEELLSRMRQQARAYGATIREGKADCLEIEDDGFCVRVGMASLRARTVLLATGVQNHRPAMPQEAHDAAVARGLIRYCPVCDGFEAKGMNIGVLGCSEHGAAEAEFLRPYGAKVTLLTQRMDELPSSNQKRLTEQRIETVKEAVRAIRASDNAVIVTLEGGDELPFDTLYPALGSTPQTRLATALGVEVANSGCIVTDAHQQTSVADLYAAGDVVEGLDQISMATGQAANAATAIHNRLRIFDK